MAFVLAISLALFVRVAPLIEPVYYVDEVFSIVFAGLPVPDLIQATIKDVHPPLYYMILRPFIEFGKDWVPDWAGLAWIRIPSIAFGLAVCLSGWFTARRRWDKRSALALLLLLGLSPALAHQSLEIRNYSLLHFLMLTGLLAMVEGVESWSRRAKAPWLIFALSWTAALYTHNLALIYFCPGIAILAYEVWKTPHRKFALQSAGLALFLIAFLYAFWIPSLLVQQEHIREFKSSGQGRAAYYLTPPPGFSAIAATLFHFVLGAVDVRPTGVPLGYALMAATLIGLAGFLIFVSSGIRQSSRTEHPSASSPDRMTIYAAGVLFGGLAQAFLLGRLTNTQIFIPGQYNLVALPLWLVILVGLGRRISSPRARGWIFSGFAAMSFFAAIGTQAIRVRARNDFNRLPLEKRDPYPKPGDTIFWLQDGATPWMSVNGKYRAHDLKELHASEFPQGDSWILGHVVVSEGILRAPETESRVSLARKIVGEGLATEVEGGFRRFSFAWKMSPEGLRRFVSEIRAADNPAARGESANVPLSAPPSSPAD